jgi:hypothetical protein
MAIITISSRNWFGASIVLGGSCNIQTNNKMRMRKIGQKEEEEKKGREQQEREKEKRKKEILTFLISFLLLLLFFSAAATTPLLSFITINTKKPKVYFP